MGYGGCIDTDLDESVVYTEADIDEILGHLNASVAGSLSLIDRASRSNLEIARLIGGSGLTSIRLACPTRRGESVELIRHQGVWQLADHG